MNQSFYRIFGPVFGSALTWNLAFGMTYLLIPLYALSLGFSGVAIGSLIAIPMIAHGVFNLLGGAWADRLGGMAITLVAFAATTVAGVIFALSSTFAWLFVAHLVMAVGRSIYWPANWALTSQLPGDKVRHMGTLNVVTNVGQIAGTIVAGGVIAWWGYQSGFWIVAVLGALSLALGLAFRYDAAKPQKQSTPMFANYATLLRRRATYYGIMCSYIAALPVSLSLSFHPILLVEQGFDSGETGWLLSLRAVGSIAAGAVLARFIRRTDKPDVPLASALIVAFTVGVVAYFRNPVIIALFLLGLGLGSGIITIFFQLLVATFSSTEERGSAMALAGAGWTVSNISTPLVMGWLNDTYGIHAAFYLIGGFTSLCSFALFTMHGWMHREGRFL